MPTNRVTGNAKDGIVVLRVERDKEWDRIQIAERFEVPYVDYDRLSRTRQQVYRAMVEGTAHAVGKKAIERYEKLRHWRFDSSRAPFLDVSENQIDIESGLGVEQGSLITGLGRKAYVLKMWFIAPKLEVQYEVPEPEDPEVTDGFVNPYKMPAFYDLKD